ncbi:MAG TPA: MGMT family protein [Candidatus Jorgensenbacteria bacterium]|nr:MGMT family protein [Candidatus Jorgensenbacteria bacterium]
MTLFKRQVYAVVKTVPRGNVITYAKVAQHISHPHAHRAVGNALKWEGYIITFSLPLLSSQTLPAHLSQDPQAPCGPVLYSSL